jgi:hypothetical protein
MLGVGKTMFNKYFLKSVPFLSLLLLATLILAQSYGTLASERGSPDTAEAALKRHMALMVQKFPEIEGKRAQVQEELAKGKMPHEACSHCHIKGNASQPSGS